MRKYALAVTTALLWAMTATGVAAQLRHGDEVVTVQGAKQVRARSAPAFRRDGEDTFIRWLPRGTQLKRVERQGEWWKVLLPGGGEAYVSAKYAREDVARDKLVVIPTRANVRRNPSTSSEKVGTVSRNDELALVRERNNWFLALLPGGERRGWIRSDMVDRKPVDPTTARAAPEPEAASTTEAVSKPKVPVAPAPEPQADFYQDGLDLAAEGRVKEAIAALTKAVEASPNDGAVHFELAKLLQKNGDRGPALKHFRAAIKGKPSRPEARFFVDALLSARADTAEVPAQEAVPQAETPWLDAVLQGSGYVLPGAAIGSLLFLVMLGLLYRRRRAGRTGAPMYRRRKPDAGFDSVLKYAVEKRPLLRAVEEAERKRAELDEALSQQFQAVGSDTESGPQLPEVASTEALLKRVEDLRSTIVSQEERAQVYAELVVLQNQKIQALDDEIEALKKLIQMDYKETADGGKPRPAKGKPKADASEA
jgi:tetratricopeptide (TPR) repeat protein